MRLKLVTPKDLKPGDVVFQNNHPVEVVSCEAWRDTTKRLIIWGHEPGDWVVLPECAKVSVALLTPEQITAIENVNAEWMGKKAKGHE